ncbi:MAG: hypothetical protein EXS00_00385 [Phycisphaerales bacterium]|nr:hypothetical protein [Phycisphaerales bacterium]
MNATSGRARALDRIAEHAKRFPDLVFIRPSAGGSSDARDAALERSIEQATLRHWAALRSVVSAKLTRPWTSIQPEVRAALLGGAAQMLLMDRIPDHAIVDEGVEWTKRATRGPAGAFVNAVLHRVSEMRKELLPKMPHTEWSQRRDVLPRDDGSAWVLTEAVFSPEELPRVCAQTSLPKLLLERWRSRMGVERSLELAAATLIRPPIIVTAIDEALAKVHLEAGTLRPHAQPGFYVADCPRDELDSLVRSSTYARAQDPSSAEAVAATRGLSVKVALDACAGRGTKSLQLGEVHPQALILAFEPDSDRRRDLGTLKGRLGAERFQVLHPSEFEAWAGKIDLLLLDVPCTNTAVLSRRVEARHRFGAKTLDSVCELQQAITKQFTPFLADTGTIVWSTCSLEEEEDTRAARRVATDTNRAVKSESLQWPIGLPGDDPVTVSTGSYHAVIG